MEPTASLARRLWHVIEPIHAVAYFDPGPTDALKLIGLRGYWMCYFAGRFAPLGTIGASPAAAMAYGFAPAMVTRALPDAWRFAAPDQVLTTQLESAAAALGRAVPPGLGHTVDELTELLSEAAAGCRYEGRPLAAGWLEVDPGGTFFVPFG